MKCGLLPMSREAMVLGDISYYDYCGAMVDQEEKDKLTRAMGPIPKVCAKQSSRTVQMRLHVVVKIE